MDRFYIFYVDKFGNICYERSCGTKLATTQRIEKLQELHTTAFSMKINDIPKDFKFYY